MGEAHEDEPPRDPFAVLSRWERFAVRFAAAFHRAPLVWFARVWHVAFVETLLIPFLVRRLRVGGLERLEGVSRDAPILVVANHRTYFDLFAVFYVLRRRKKWRHPICFPVRSDFFYENPFGLLVGAISSACAMYPPIFRKGRARAFNAHSLELLAQELRTQGRMVGFHPEGTRNRSEDRYALLPAKRGAGELALGARPVVIPAFISGLRNSPGAEILDSARWRPRSPIRITFGAPIDLSQWPKSEPGAAPSHADAQSCADAIMAAIARLAGEQRAEPRSEVSSD